MSAMESPATICSPSLNREPAWIAALARPAEQAWLCVLLLSVLCGILFFYGLNAGELWRTETLRAILAAEFLRSGNWIVPTLYGEPLFTKPPGMYAAIALCSLPFGAVTETTARLPSALAAAATVFLVYWYFGRQLGRLGGLVAALVLPLSPLWLEKATSAEIDMLQVFWTTAAILFFLRALESEEEIRGQRSEVRDSSLSPCLRVTLPSCHPALWWMLALLCVAGGFLTKWTTPAFFYLTAVPLLWWRGELRLLASWKHLLSAGLALSLCLAWAAAAVALAGWDVFADTIEREACQRLVPGYTPFPYPWKDALLHPVKILAVTLPFSPLALLTVRPGFMQLWDARGRLLLQALHCWAWPNLLFMSFPTEHAPRHSFPLFPALAGLAAFVLLAWLTGKLPWRWMRLKPQHLLIGTLAVWLVLKCLHVQAVVPRHSAERPARATGELLAQLLPADRILYIFGLKDEGVMFYYGRKALRLSSLTDVPPATIPVHGLLVADELRRWRDAVEVVQPLTDAQGEPIFLVRVLQ